MALMHYFHMDGLFLVILLPFSPISILQGSTSKRRRLTTPAPIKHSGPHFQELGLDVMMK